LNLFFFLYFLIQVQLKHPYKIEAMNDHGSGLLR
jgi:hypothetical protein